MNIPQGYKQTELGIIPEDWEVTQLCKGLRFQTGYPFQSSYFNRDGIGVRLIRNRDLKSDDSITHYSGAIYNEFIVNNYDILIGMDGDFMPCVWDKGVALLNQRVGRLVVKNNWSPRFLYYALQEPLKQKEQGTGATTVKHLSHSDIERILMSIPPSKEQRAIAEALSDVDGLIAALDKKIAKKRLLKQGAMQQLLTGKKRLPGFTDEWVEKPIRLLCKLYGRIGFRGYTKADLVHKGEGAITFSPSDIHEQVISYTNCDYISWRKYDESPEIQVFNGDIIFCKTASIGKCAIIKNLSEKATINPQFVVLKDFKCNNEWLYYSIIDRKFQTVVSGITGGSTIPTMSQEKLYEQTLLCPPTIEEQQAIATILSDMDKEIADLEAQRDKYRLLKSGMMQKLLTGQIRLKTE